MPNTKTIASNATVNLWAALVSQRLERGEPLRKVLPGISATIAKFSQLKRSDEKVTVRMLPRRG